MFPAFAFEALAQEPVQAHLDAAHLTGAVEAFGTARALAGARVEARRDGETLAVSETGEDGRFALTVPAGGFQVRVEHPDWLVYEGDESAGRGETLDVVYRLRPPPLGEEMVVFGERARDEVSRQVISVEELRLVPGSFGDPVRALQSLPGVARPSILEGALVLRGAEGLNTGFYVDEMPVPYMFHMLLGRSVINPAFVDDVEFFPGGMPSRFGEVLQGAVNVRTSEESVHGRTTTVDVNLLDAGAAVEVGGDRWTVRSAGRYSWIGGLIGGVSGAIVVFEYGGDWYEATYIYPRYWDWFTSVEHRPRQGAKVDATLIASRDAFVIHEGRWDGDGDGDPDPLEWEAWDLPYNPEHLMDAYFVRLRLRWREESRYPPVSPGTPAGLAHASDSWIAVGPQMQQNLLGDVFTSMEGPYNGRVTGWTGQAAREDRWTFGPRHGLLAGGRATLTRVEAQDYRSVWESEGTRIPSQTDDQVAAGVYGEWQFRPDPWLVSPGLRGSLYAFNEDLYVEPEPRFTLRRKLTPDVAAKAFVGRFTQMPPIERYAQGIGNPELPLMTAWQASAGEEWSPGALSVDSSIYASRMEHLVVRDLTVDIREDQWGSASAVVEPAFVEVEGRAYGWESLVRVRPSGPLWGWAALTLGRSERLLGDRVFPGDHDQPFALTLLGAWQAPRRWDLSARFRLTSGQPFTPLLGVYDPVIDAYTAYPGETNSDRFPLFHQLDLRVQKTWTRRRGDWSAYLDLFNAYWARNPFAASYNYDYTELVPIIHLPVIPTFGLEARF